MYYFRAFWSCGEVEVLDGGGVVAGEVVLVAVALLVVAHVVVKIAVDDDGAYLEDVSAPWGDHLAPVIPNLSSITNRQAPSIIPVAIGHPFARALSYFMCCRLLFR